MDKQTAILILLVLVAALGLALWGWLKPHLDVLLGT